MRTTVKPDGSPEYVDGLDRHYYERQVGAASPFDHTHQFKLAAARAKDQARHQLVKAVRVEAAKARGDLNAASGRAARDGERRSVDGVEGAPDDAIKL